MPSTKTILSTAASLAASAMLIRTIANDFIPDEVRNYVFSNLHSLSRHFSSELTIVIEEFQGLSLNQVFEAADAYLGTKLTPSVRRVKVSKDEKEKKLVISVDRNEEVVDVFEDVQVKWTLICQQVQSASNNVRHQGDLNTSLRSEVRYYELSFHKKHKEKVMDSYLPYVLERSKAIREESKAIKLHTVDYRCWDPNALSLDHPMTFDNLAMDSEVKKMLVDDLDNFIKGKEFYRRIGKAWKRGYLLYGPPGTGKSSLIAAMANHLNYDIYDLDLTDVNSNSDLRVLLLGMSNRSILVVEDIDCSINLQNRESEDEQVSNRIPQVTLSGLLNFIDGLWSCCGDERVIVFTTNYKDRLDPALLRPGRMDMHIHMSYCTFSAFKQLAFNYLGIHHHKQLFEQIEGLIAEVKVTPAEVAGELMKSSDVEVSLQGLVKFLHHKRSEQDKAENNKKIEAQQASEGKEDNVKKEIDN